MLTDPVAEQDRVKLFIPVIVVFIHNLHQGMAQGLVKPFCESVRLRKEESNNNLALMHSLTYLWMVSTCDSVFCFGPHKQRFGKLVYKFPSLVRNYD